VTIKLEDKRKWIDQLYDPRKIESVVRDFYERIDLNRFVSDYLKGKDRVGFVEGPPTLNNQPHLGHVRGRIMKDIWYRHNTLRGKKIIFRGGWDTQGLPVELEAEKELGLTGNKWENLKKIGEEALVKACKELVEKYKGFWLAADSLIGLYMDQKNAYMTYLDSYIEREWKYLESAWKKGLLGEGFKVVPYCPSCQTALSHAELNLGGYEKLEDPSLYYKVECEDGSFLVVWTTMPFTLITDQMIAVRPEADYAYLRKDKEVWVVAKSRIEEIEKELSIKFDGIEKVVKGKELEGKRYRHPFLELIPGLKKMSSEGKAHFVVAEDFVDITTGSGLVHLAPSNGEEDFGVAQRRGIPVFAPFDDQVKFTSDAGYFSGKFARDTDSEVIEILRERGLLVHAGKMVHDYPVCWRSGHRIVWLARKEYFYWIDRIKEKLIDAAQNVEYFFEQPKNRFIEFIRESPPWCISRERIWGTPLPIWVCSECGEKNPLFSREEIVENALELPDGRDFELHRPWIDRIVVKCKKCGGKAYREPFVLDTWHNSGSAPYSSMTDDEYSELIPVPFLTEGIDQTRGWAYTLLVLNVIMKDRPEPPYKSFLFQGHVLDPQGRKMSKSLGNVIWALELLKDNPADLVRFYLMWKSSPEDTLALDVKEMTSRPYQVLNTLYHLHVYFQLNSSIDNFDMEKHTLEWAFSTGKVMPHDKWLLMKLKEAEKNVFSCYERMRFNEACKEIEKFVIEIMSQGYVRMVRPELWSEKLEEAERRLVVYSFLCNALKRVCYMLHPVSPFLTEYLYQSIFAKEAWNRPMMVDMYPESIEEEYREDEKAVDSCVLIEQACNVARSKAKLKRRWPIRDIYILQSDGENMERVEYLISSLCNVKNAVVSDDPKTFPAKFRLVPNPSKIGSLFKEKTREVLERVREFTDREALEVLSERRKVYVSIGNEELELPSNCFDLLIEPERGFEVVENSGFFIAIRKERDRELIAEGLVRDIARRIQALRKEKGYPPTAMVTVARIYGLEEEDKETLYRMKDTLSFLVRAKKVEFPELREGDEWKKDELDGREIWFQVLM
jgi:isoleucyl-tRNA synthetase